MEGGEGRHGRERAVKVWSRLATVVIITLFVTTTGLVGIASGDQAAQQVRPLKVSLDFVGVVVGGQGSMGCDDASFPGVLDGDGRVTHLGRTEVLGFDCVDFVTGAITNGTGIYTAANGDTLEVTFSGQADVSADGATFTGDGTTAVVGGSGRFARASGYFAWTMTGSISPDGTTWTSLSGDGWIAYDASDRNR
jgi:hypothetical protein